MEVGLISLYKYVGGNWDRMNPAKIFSGPPAEKSEMVTVGQICTLKKILKIEVVLTREIE